MQKTIDNKLERSFLNKWKKSLRRAYNNLLDTVYDFLKNEAEYRDFDTATENADRIFRQARKLRCTKELGEYIREYEQKRQIPSVLGDRFRIDYIKEPVGDKDVKFQFSCSQKKKCNSSPAYTN